MLQKYGINVLLKNLLFHFYEKKGHFITWVMFRANMVKLQATSSCCFVAWKCSNQYHKLAIIRFSNKNTCTSIAIQNPQQSNHSMYTLSEQIFGGGFSNLSESWEIKYITAWQIHLLKPLFTYGNGYWAHMLTLTLHIDTVTARNTLLFSRMPQRCSLRLRKSLIIDNPC